MKDSLSETEDPLDQLTPELQERLGLLLDKYFSGVEAGEAADASALIAQHPELERPLRHFLRSVDILHDALGARPSEISSSSVSSSHEASEIRDVIDPLSASQLGDYRIEAEIGRGGMGIVYSAHQMSLGRKVALKVLPFASVLDPRQIARFKNEAQAAAQLHHPNIVPVYAVGCERGVHYFSMQLIEGQAIDKAIADLQSSAGLVPSPSKEQSSQQSITNQSFRSRSYIRSVAELGIQAASALHHAHEFGIVHRDIKPSNLMLDGSGKLWVTDFGLARCRAGSNITASGDLLGTARYMSPEQADGRSHEVDHRTDIYSLGITLYEMLTLKFAFDGPHRMDVLRKIRGEEPARPRDANSSLPFDLENILLKAIAKQKEDRYESAEAFSDDLQRFLDGKPTAARRPSVVDRAAKWAMRRKRSVAVAATLVLVALVGTSISTAMIAAQKTQAQRATAKAQFHLRELQRVVDNFGAQVSEKLRDVPGAAPVRSEILGELEKYYTDFLVYANDDPLLRKDLATSQFKLATIQATVGDKDKAIASFQASIQQFERLRNLSLHDLQPIRDLRRCYCSLSELFRTQKRWYQSADAMRAAIDLSKRLPESETSILARAAQENNLGQLELALGDADAAIPHFTDALELLTLPDISKFEASEVASSLGGVANNLGIAFETLGDPNRAASAFADAIKYQAQALQTSPANLRYLQMLQQHQVNRERVLLVSTTSQHTIQDVIELSESNE